MNNLKQKSFILTKRTHSHGSKLQRSQSKNSITKQNEHPDISNISKYFRQQQKEEFHPDQTDRFLTQTKNKLYCSSQKLQQFHKKKQQFRFLNQTLNFKNVSKQLKETKQKILSKNFMKGNQIIYQNYKSKNEGKLNIEDDYDVNKKCLLIQKVLIQDEALNFRTQLEKRISELKIQYREDVMMRDKLIKYFINHQIISRFLEETAKDTTKLIFKKININLYHKMKDQMVALLSDQEHFQKHIQEINTQEQLRINSLLKRTPYNQQKLVKVHIKPKKSANYEKPLLEKIEDLLQLSKNNIKQAFIKFGKTPKSNEIQQQFNKRLNNNFLVE